MVEVTCFRFQASDSTALYPSVVKLMPISAFCLSVCAFQFPLLPLEDLDYNDIMSIDQIAAEALRLPPRERALLAESLWESLSSPDETSADMDDRAALALARERDQQIEAGEVSPVLHDEMMARLRR